MNGRSLTSDQQMALLHSNEHFVFKPKTEKYQKKNFRSYNNTSIKFLLTIYFNSDVKCFTISKLVGSLCASVDDFVYSIVK